MRIAVEGNANVEIIYVDDGSDDVIVEGTIGTLEVAGDGITVTAVGATRPTVLSAVTTPASYWMPDPHLKKARSMETPPSLL